MAEIKNHLSNARAAGRVSLADHAPAYRYGALLFMLIATFFFIGSAPQGRWQPLAIVLVESATLLVALLASGARRLIVIVSLVFIGVSTLAGLSAGISGSGHLATATSGLLVLLVIVAPVTVVRGLVARRTIDLKTVLGALCLYVMAGLFFGTFFSAIQAISHHQFFVQINHGNPSDFLYFSFITMTTVGYGDLTAARGFSRTLASFEATFGQLYLVTVVALLVSNLGPAFRRNRDLQASAQADE